jgi:hypothetical protein
MPLVVRPHALTVRIVSPAVIMGAMRGQAWISGGNESELQRFIICRKTIGGPHLVTNLHRMDVGHSHQKLSNHIA